jgi:predicted amidohydrolase
MTRELIIATFQFPVSGDIKKNAAYILRQMTEAKEKGADISHFPESSLGETEHIKGFCTAADCD